MTQIKNQSQKATIPKVRFEMNIVNISKSPSLKSQALSSLTASTNPKASRSLPHIQESSQVLVRSKGCVEWKVEQLIHEMLFPKFKFIMSDAIMENFNDKKVYVKLFLLN